MRVAICDDEIIYHTAITEAINRWREKHPLSTVFVKCFRSTEELLYELTERLQVDIVFLDIQIPNEMSGLELARQIRLFNECITIVFVTNYVQYACDAYHVNALRYLRKPIHPGQVEECLDIAYKKWKLLQNQVIVISDYGGKFVLPYNSILYVEARGHTLMIFRTSEENSILLRMQLGKFMEQLPSDLFVKCHRSFVVNILYVRRITRDTLTLANGCELSIGKQFRDVMMAAFDRYYQGTSI